MQGISAEEIAKEWKLSREELDRYSLRVARARGARARRGALREGDHPDRPRRARAGGDGGGTATLTRTRFAVDEAIRETTLEKMASLQPAFIPDGVVTAGNSSQIVDGSAAVLIASEQKASELGLRAARPLRRLRHRRRRPAHDAARQSRGLRARAREGRPRRGTTWR